MRSYARLKYACYTANISMSVIANLPPLLFLTFRSLYGISFSLLGLLVLVNFVTQMIVDLIFSFFSHRFSLSKAIKLTPVLTVLGLWIYGLTPVIFSGAPYVGLLIGTIVFSASGGFVEVLLSPAIAAIPSDNTDREMSKLHSVYAWGVVAVIPISTLYLLLCGSHHWQWLVFGFSIIPLLSVFLFLGASIPAMETPKKVSGVFALLRNGGLWLFAFAMFLGGAAECTMAQWASGYLEQALGIPKTWGDIGGVAMFAVMLGLGRTLYAKRGKQVTRVLFWGAVGATVCYLTCALTTVPLIGLAACALTGFCTSMLWPGTLIVSSERFPQGGVFIFAMMAAGGDLGASVGPQLVGIVTDLSLQSKTLLSLAELWGIAPEQLGMKLGMICAMFFPLIAIGLYMAMHHQRNDKKRPQKDVAC